MSNTIDYRAVIFQRTRALDVEVAEDLYRRMPEIKDLATLNQFFHLLLAQYKINTLELRCTLNEVNDFEAWWRNFAANFIPLFRKKRLPPCTDAAAQPMYHCESKSI
ncbi:hypothetical protein [Pseudomonas phage PA1C]|uniref:Uncharacterized protein n=1 Tax=Pseudomonas phage vB_PaeM_PS119XW TaxID=2601632 RepID=A0A5C1K9F8_9CAUD|nr:hypothetical protein PP933_gp175 [Pseudomonas phage vB_PaeM_PS119XW]QBX32331.1 hypothetical protein [Pseudomonas phage PA1C]QEM41904.1 hypothetical protein [Pseudomonas phage vB_PaeM_PS119XW]BEG72420.1 hypothetical protein RVBP21_0480 [Pseudomonas phage BRkr]